MQVFDLFIMMLQSLPGFFFRTIDRFIFNSILPVGYCVITPDLTYLIVSDIAANTQNLMLFNPASAINNNNFVISLRSHGNKNYSSPSSMVSRQR